jgi:hypothetical protein
MGEFTDVQWLDWRPTEEWWRAGGREIFDAELGRVTTELRRSDLTPGQREALLERNALLGDFLNALGRTLKEASAKHLKEAEEREREHPGWDAACAAEAGVPELLPRLRRHVDELDRTYPRPDLRIVRVDALAGDVANLGRWQRGTTRERRPQGRRAQRAGAGSRDGPLPRADDEPPDAALTPLQRATLLMLESLVRASEGGRRTYVTFLDLMATRVAAEIAKATDWGDRP